MTQPPPHPPALTVALPRSLVLVGLMGAGKSSVGKALAKRLNLPFYDSDQEIEAAAGCSVSDIFARDGETAFRTAEYQVVRRLLNNPALGVIATGGGAFVQPRTHDLIQSCALSLWLNVPVDILCERTARHNTRPLLRQGDPHEILTRLLAERGPLYATAHLELSAGDTSVEDTAGQALALLQHYLETKS